MYVLSSNAVQRNHPVFERSDSGAPGPSEQSSRSLPCMRERSCRLPCCKFPVDDAGGLWGAGSVLGRPVCLHRLSGSRLKRRSHLPLLITKAFGEILSLKRQSFSLIHPIAIPCPVHAVFNKSTGFRGFSRCTWRLLCQFPCRIP